MFFRSASLLLDPFHRKSFFGFRLPLLQFRWLAAPRRNGREGGVSLLDWLRAVDLAVCCWKDRRTEERASALMGLWALEEWLEEGSLSGVGDGGAAAVDFYWWRRRTSRLGEEDRGSVGCCGGKWGCCAVGWKWEEMKEDRLWVLWEARSSEERGWYVCSRGREMTGWCGVGGERPVSSLFLDEGSERLFWKRQIKTGWGAAIWKGWEEREGGGAPLKDKGLGLGFSFFVFF